MASVGFGKKIRERLTSIIADLPDGVVGIPISHGVDSNSILCSALESGREVIGFSFTINGRVSRDAHYGRENCRRMGVTHKRVLLDARPDVLLRDVRELIGRYSLEGKADIECAYPFLHLCASAASEGCDLLVTGSAADGHYGLSKKAMIHYRNDRKKFDSYRREYFSKKDRAQTVTVDKISTDNHMIGSFAPYRDAEIVELFLTQGWYELNRPKQKQPIREAYANEFRLLNIGNTHVNLQLGDSGISNAFKSLLPLVPGSKSSVKVYNAIRRGEL